MNQITTDELRRLHYTEGLVIQGCGGDLDEWIDGITDMLTKENILLDGDTFKDISTFEHEGVTNLLFSLEKVKLDWNKLAMWRLQSHSQFGGTWLSDYVPNRLGDFIVDDEQEHVKPDCPLVGQDGNIFNLMGIASNTLKEHGMSAEAKEMRERITSSGSYDEALCIISEYVNITSINDSEEYDEDYDEDYDEEHGGMEVMDL